MTPATVARAALKAASALFSAKKKEGGGASKFVGALIGALGIAIVSVYVVIEAPLGAWALITGGDEGAQTSAYGIYDMDIDGTRVSWYLDEEKSLNSWARHRWNSGEEDIYNTPDWRYLYAFDMALTENNFTLVKENEDYYKSLHKNLMSATSVVHTRTVDAQEGEDGAVYDEERDVWVKEETYTTWSVNTKDLSSFFKKKSFTGVVTEDFLYFANYESGDWGAEGGWGDQGNALGGLQFDRRYALDDFLLYVVDTCPGEYDYLLPWAGVGTISQADGGLLFAWRQAYAQDEERWQSLQVQFEYDSYYLPGEEALAGLGFDCSGRPDAIKGLVASLCNLNGVGGATRFFRIANLDESMSDEEVARSLAGVIIDNPPNPYPTAYANRYTRELEVVLDLLANGSATCGESATHLGDNADAEGNSLTLDLKGELAKNYQRALYAVDISYDSYGVLTATVDEKRFQEIVVYGGEIASLDNATTEEGTRIVEACQSVDSPGAGYCAMWVSLVYQAAGCGYPTGNANDMWRVYCTSSDLSDLVPGMIVAVEHSSGTGDGWTYGHVGIYVGEVDGVPTVMDNVGYVRTISLDAWIAENNYSGDVAWGWAL